MHDVEAIEQGETVGQAELFPDAPHIEFPEPFSVKLKWYTPQGDKMIAHMARVSNSKATDSDPAERLIGYLIRNKHWSPAEMASVCLEISTQRDISAQILRHRSFSFQEFSTRYAQVEKLLYSTECRFQGTTNRQSSKTFDDLVAEHGPVPGVNGELAEETVSYFDAVVNETRTRSMEAYEELLRRGVAKEVARRILPIGLMPTRLYMTGTLRSWVHYLSLRMAPSTQTEHRVIAVRAYQEIAQCFPLFMSAAYDEGLFSLPSGETFDGVLRPRK